MSGHLLQLSCLIFFLYVSPSECASYPDLLQYTHQVSIIRDMLRTEGCEDLMNKREILGMLDQHRYEVRVEVQKKIYQHLEDVLVQCRRAALKKKSSTAPTSPPTTAPTSPPTTAPTSPPTTAPTSPPTTAPLPTECQSALNLTESWRQDYNWNDTKPLYGDHVCDTGPMIENGRPWFRFSGAAGNRLMNKCVPKRSCGSNIALWSDDTMPTKVGVITNIYVYGSDMPGDDCRYKDYTRKTSVVRCSLLPHDFVYRYDDEVWCDLAFCGMTA